MAAVVSQTAKINTDAVPGKSESLGDQGTESRLTGDLQDP
jgi:hypothetical protein